MRKRIIIKDKQEVYTIETSYFVSFKKACIKKKTSY